MAGLYNKRLLKCLFSAIGFVTCSSALSENIFGVSPKILEPSVQEQHFLPDFSYAGYKHGEQHPDISDYKVVDVSQHKIIADDGIDDSKALIALLDKLKASDEPTILQFKPGRYIISSIIYFDRNYTVMRGAGAGEGGTEFYFPRPLIYAQPPPELKELREYLVKLDKIQREKRNNIYLPFTEWAWSGGYFWTRIDGVRVKKYLDEYDENIKPLAQVKSGVQGGFSFEVNHSKALKVGQIIEIQWLNDKGENGPLLSEIYQGQDVYIGSHHWNFTKLPLSRQQVEIMGIDGDTVSIRSPLLHNINEDLTVQVVKWEHLTHIGFEDFKISFAPATRIAHHVEQGFNAFYLTRLYNGWIDNVHIDEADSGVLMEEVANLNINNVVTSGAKHAHYSVQMGGVHNVLVENLKVLNKVEHPLSLNTFSTKSVYKNAYVAIDPVLDQHSGVNHQNLFDNITVEVTLNESSSSAQLSYPLFAGGGAKYWKPSHGAFNTFWNIQVNFANGHQSVLPNQNNSVLLNGMKDGVGARLIGVNANLPVSIEYAPKPYIEATNEVLSEPSLYEYQLKKRLLK